MTSSTTVGDALTASVVGNVQSGCRFATLPGLIRDVTLLNVWSRFRPYIGQSSSAQTLSLISNASANPSIANIRVGRIVSSLIARLLGHGQFSRSDIDGTCLLRR